MRASRLLRMTYDRFFKAERPEKQLKGWRRPQKLALIETAPDGAGRWCWQPAPFSSQADGRRRGSPSGRIRLVGSGNIFIDLVHKVAQLLFGVVHGLDLAMICSKSFSMSLLACIITTRGHGFNVAPAGLAVARGFAANRLRMPRSRPATRSAG
ncbi:MAG TPA: hypothetical protein VF532_17395 [Candidatus Angelobacter sp.]